MTYLGGSRWPLCHSLPALARYVGPRARLWAASAALLGACADGQPPPAFVAQCALDADCDPVAAEHGYSPECAVWHCAEGLCRFSADLDGRALQGLPCDDGTACTKADACHLRRCEGAPVDCDDGVACSQDTCDELTGDCVHALVTSGPCDDGVGCTVDDTCTSLGACIGTPGPTCGCAEDADCEGAVAADKCAGPLRCLNFECAPDGTEPVVCGASLTTACTAASCNSATGSCSAVSAGDGAACGLADNPCVLAGVCASGDCVGELVDCDDANVCTIDVCEPKLGGCLHEPLPGTCDDDDICTVNDVCDSAGACHGQPRICDDGNECTLGLCEAATGACSFLLLAGGCDDGDPCSEADACHDGACTGVPVACSDGDPCTKDLCLAVAGVGGCQHVDQEGPCEDGDPCTLGDVCAEGLCTPGLDGCGCHADADCDPLERGDLCVGDLVCDTAEIPWACSPVKGTATICGDSGDPCEASVCDPRTGSCFLVELADGASCDDGDPCTQQSVCVSKVCAPGLLIACDDLDPCTADSCTDGQCVHAALTGGETFLAEGFDAGWPAAWAVTTDASSKAVWVASPDFDVDGDGFGLVATGAGGTYDGPVQTVARSPPLAVWGQSLTATFMSRSQLADSDCSHDRMVVGVEVAGAFSPLVAICASEPEWSFHEVDLSAFSGSTLRLVFVFEADGENNGGFGLAIDQVTTVAEFTCDDGTACTTADTCYFGVCAGEAVDACE